MLTSSPGEIRADDLWEIGTGGRRLNSPLYGPRLTSLVEVEAVLGPLKPHDIRARGGRIRPAGHRRPIRITAARQGRSFLASAPGRVGLVARRARVFSPALVQCASVPPHARGRGYPLRRSYLLMIRTHSRNLWMLAWLVLAGPVGLSLSADDPPADPHPVVAWPAGPFEVRVAFTRPLDPGVVKRVVGRLIPFEE